MRQDVLKQSSICLMVLDINQRKLIISRPIMIGVVYIHLLAVLRFMKSSVSHGRTVKSAFLVILMIIMTQVGYLDLINSPRTGNDSFDDDSSVMETGGSGSSFAYANDKVSTGYAHTCAILDNGDMKCWGSQWTVGRWWRHHGY